MGLKDPNGRTALLHLPLGVAATELGALSARRPYFLFVGRLEKIKGLQELLPVFGHYEKAQLWIVGVGDYEPVLHRMARGISKHQVSGVPVR